MMNTDSPGSSKLRILIFNWRDLAHPLAGGAEVYTHRVAEEWIKMGHEVTLFCASVEGKPEIEYVKDIKIIRRGGKHSVYGEARKYYNHEGSGNYDLVIDEVNTRPFGASKWVNDAQVVALIHQVCRDVWFKEVTFPIAIIGRYILEPYWLKKYRNILTITVSESSRESLQLYGLKDISVIPEGFDVMHDQVNAMKEDAPTIIFIGRLSPNKRPIDAIKAFVLFKKTCPDAVLKIIGSGPLEKKIKRNLPNGVEFLGRVDNDQKNYQLSKAHVLVATSVREGWGLVVTEASLMGTNTIAYNVPGLRDSVKASKGILSNPDPYSLFTELKNFFDFYSKNGYPEVSTSGVLPWREVAIKIIEVCSNV